MRVSTVTREHEHRIDEDLTHTRVEIQRVPIGRPIDTAPPVREEGDTTILSVVEEVIVIRRQLVLKEEVRIRRVQVAERYQDNVTVRQQDISVTRIEAPTAAGGNAPPTVDTIPGS